LAKLTAEEVAVSRFMWRVNIFVSTYHPLCTWI